MRTLFVGIAVVLVLVIVYNFRYKQVSADYRTWQVSGGFDNSAAAAALLSRVNRRMIEFMRHLRRKYHIDETEDIIKIEGAEHDRVVKLPNDVHNMVAYMLDNYNPDKFYENDPRFTTDTSYTLNKGSAMYICLRDKKNPEKLADEDTLLFTMIHEAAHIANYRGWGHGKDFWEIFKFLLHEAATAGVYHPVDYSKHPVTFCGLNIPWNPLFDESVHSIWKA